MAGDSFSFKRFVVHQERCAMKVGTDGTLLGAWAAVAPNVERPSILDIGTGTGLIALMMAQRFPSANITAIDIDEEAVCQAAQNTTASPFEKQITVRCTPLQSFSSQTTFDAIICNPPFFEHSLTCPNSRRTASRHTTALTFRELMTHAYRLLSDDGEMSVVIPFDAMARMEEAAAIAGFFLRRQCEVKTTPTKAPKRLLMSFVKTPTTEGVERMEIVIGGDAYRELTQDFYL